jgi:acyl dehydratase
MSDEKSNAETAHELFTAALGSEEGAGEWLTIDQERINAFAECTEDHQFIHVDPDMAAQLSPWGTTIAHGFLTLSMLTKLMATVPTDPARFQGIVMGVNYGFEKVRFINAVKVNSRIRATSVLSAAALKGNNIDMTRTITVEIEGEEKPALVCDWITRLVYG